jgi:hypothetical protein
MTKDKQPIILFEGDYDAAALADLRKYPTWQMADILERQLADVFEITHPGLARAPEFEARQREFVRERLGTHPELVGDWIYLPWSGALLHGVGQKEQFALRTNRNRHLITTEEQDRLASAKVAIAGLSVGGGIAVGLVYAGIAGRMCLADFDVLETPNLNRVRARLADIGAPKAEVVARQIWDVDPYAQLTVFPKGITVADLSAFFGADDPANVVLDEIDDFEMKVRIRHEAKRRRIPVLMLTGLGDSVLLDVERYDLEPELSIFNGLIGQVEDEILSGKMSPADMKRYAAQIVGIDNVPTRAIQSLLDMGSKLVGRPQLGGTVTMESGFAAFAIRQLVLGAPLASGRYRLDLNQVAQLPSECEDGPDRQNAIRQLFGQK